MYIPVSDTVSVKVQGISFILKVRLDPFVPTSSILYKQTYSMVIFCVWYLFFLVLLVFKLRASSLLGRHSYCLSLSASTIFWLLRYVFLLLFGGFFVF
jgi:hypothetical protein